MIASNENMPNVFLQGRMKWQFFHYNGLVVDLNCGWYCLKAALKIRYPNQPTMHSPTHPAFPSFGYDPLKNSGMTNVREILRANIPNNCLGWVNMITNSGPIITAVNIGPGGIIAHYILINGADDQQDPPGGRLYYYDPLTGVLQRHEAFNTLYPKITEAISV